MRTKLLIICFCLFSCDDIGINNENKIGNKSFINSFGTSWYEYGWGLTQLNDGGFVITGRKEYKSDNTKDMITIRTDKNGFGIWEKTYGGSNNEEGYSVKKDLNKAFELYLITLDYENPPWYTDSNIGTFFLLGKGNVEPSYERAVEHFTKAKINGGEDADKSVLYLEFLEEHKRVPDNYMELAFWLEEKAKDNAEVFIVLGWLLDDYNKKSAYEWYYLASLLAPKKAQMRATQITALLESEILETKDYMDAREKAFAWLGRNMESNVKVSPTSCSS